MKKTNVKKFTVFLCIIMIILSVGCKKEPKTEEKKSKSIKIICEDTVLPLVNDLLRDYNLNNETAITVEFLERESAFTKLNNDKADLLIGYVETENKKIESEMLAFDGLGVIVNTNNKVTSVGVQELKKIYTGNLINWENLKGEAQTIVPVAYKTPSSLVQEVFNIKIMNTPIKEQMSSSVHYVSSVEEMKTFVAQNKNAIGFIPGQWYNKENVFLKLNGIEITLSNLRNELYPLRFPLKMYYIKEKKESLNDLFQYLRSEDGMKIMRKYCVEAS